MYGTGGPSIPMMDSERICLFHWVTNVDKHTEKLIAKKFQNQHIWLYMQYKNVNIINQYFIIYTIFHILWSFHNICSLSSSKLSLNYLYADLVNPLWDGLPQHDMNFKTCNSITLWDLFNLKSTVMGHVVIGILNKCNSF